MHYEEEACRIENRSSFHSFGPEYVKVFLKSSDFAFGICNFSLATFRRVSMICIGQVLDKFAIMENVFIE
jgi:hypothetical protein